MIINAFIVLNYHVFLLYIYMYYYYTVYFIYMFLVPETETVGSDEVGHSTYVQYVEGTGEQAIFTNGQMYVLYFIHFKAVLIK